MEHDSGRHAAISRAIVRAMREYQGRGPTRATTTIGKNSVHCILGDTLTQSERSLAEAGYEEDVLRGRRRLQQVMRPQLVSEVEKIMERKVVAFLSENHISPDLAIESFVFEPIDDQAAASDEAD